MSPPGSSDPWYRGLQWPLRPWGCLSTPLIYNSSQRNSSCWGRSVLAPHKLYRHHRLCSYFLPCFLSKTSTALSITLLISLAITSSQKTNIQKMRYLCKRYMFHWHTGNADSRQCPLGNNTLGDKGHQTFQRWGQSCWIPVYSSDQQSIVSLLQVAQQNRKQTLWCRDRSGPPHTFLCPSGMFLEDRV